MPIDPYLRAFGRKIAKRRQARDWTQEELADRSDLTGKYVSEIERGITNISLTVLRKLATGLDTTPEALLAEDGDDTGREIQALLATRSENDRQLVLRIARAVFAKP